MPPSPVPTSPLFVKFLVLLVLVTVFSGLTAHALGFPAIGVDDANIFFVYARNVVDGHGFVYNPGGERVEGFSSLLWVLLCAGAFRLTSEPELVLFAVNVVLVSATLGLLWHLFDTSSRSRGGRTALNFFFLGATLFSPSYLTWSVVSLMDVGIWGFALTLSVVSALSMITSASPSHRRILGFAGTLALVVLTRPEGMLFGGVLLLGAAAGTALLDRSRSSFLRYTIPSLVFLGTLGSLIGFRLIYFGYPFPNTYYAKVSPDLAYNLLKGVKYLGGFFLASPLNVVLGLGIAAHFAFVATSRARSGGVRVKEGYLLLSVVTLLAIPVLNGGDHFALYRFYQPVWPLLVVVTVFVMRWVGGALPWEKTRRMRPVLYGVGAIALLSSIHPGLDRIGAYEPIKKEFAIAYEGRKGGLRLNRVFEGREKPTLGVLTAGGFRFTYEGNVIDLLGLNSVAMAHSEGDRKGIKNHAAFDQGVFFELLPDALIPSYRRRKDPDVEFGIAPLTEESFPNRALKGLLFDDRFVGKYVPVVFQVEEEEGTENSLVMCYFRRDKLDGLKWGGISFDVLEATSAPPRLLPE